VHAARAVHRDRPGRDQSQFHAPVHQRGNPDQPGAQEDQERGPGRLPRARDRERVLVGAIPTGLRQGHPMSMTQTATGGKAAVARKVAAAAAARTKKLLQAHGIPVSLGKYEPLGMTGEEELSRPFVFRLEARFPTATPEAIVAAVLGKSMALELAVDPTGTTSRFVHGQVFAIARDRVPGSPVPDAYVFSIRPRLSRLAFSADSRVFTEKTVRQVVEQVFADARVPGPTWLL